MFNLTQNIFYALLVFTSGVIILLDIKYEALRDDCNDSVKNSPYSFSRVQMSWWTILIFSAFTAASIATRQLPNLDPSLLYLLGISGGTNLFSRIIDGRGNQAASMVESKGFVVDILNKGDIHRLQSLLFNFGVGIWFAIQVVKNLITPITTGFTVDMMLPAVPQYVLVLLSMSSILYLGGKTQE
jgi:hypothetical protein